MATTTLSALKLTNAQKGTSISPIQSRRNKMSKRLWEQIQLADRKSTRLNSSHSQQSRMPSSA